MLTNSIHVLKEESNIHLVPEVERIAVDGGLQPFSVMTSKGTLLAQVQKPEELQNSERIAFHWRIGSFVSRDSGLTLAEVIYRSPADPGTSE